MNSKKVIALSVVAFVLVLGVIFNPFKDKYLMSGYGELTEENNFIEKDYEDIMIDATNGVEGIYYFGSDQCQTCQDFAPYINDALESTDNVAWYIDVMSKSFNKKNQEMLLTLDQSLLSEEFRSNGGIPLVVVIDNEGNYKSTAVILNSFQEYLQTLEVPVLEMVETRLDLMFLPISTSDLTSIE